ncbi:MAG: sulfatase-like hydrolase/transferase [Bacteroidota bacterium]
MKHLSQPIRTSFALFVFFLGIICQGSLAQTDKLKPEPKNQWSQPFITVKKNAPNILWIVTDQQRWNTIGALGNPYVKTPNLDRLVREGMSFTKAQVQSPFCTPSRASFLTGMYPSTVRASKNGAAKWAEAAPLITKTLADAGYDCGLSGKFHLSTAIAHRPEQRPKDDGYRIFDYSHSPYQSGSANDYLKWHQDRGIDIMAMKKEKGFVPTEYHQSTWCTDRAIDFIKEGREWPWLYSLNVYDPHGPFDPPREYLDRYEIDQLPLPWFQESDLEEKTEFNNVMFQGYPKQYSDKVNRERLARYWAQIDLIDDQIGRLLQVLEETEQLDHTLIIFTSDHGDMVGDHGMTAKGCRFYEGLVRVPLIFWYPAYFQENIQSEALVELTDIVPTLLELTGLKIDDRIQGKSLLPILTGTKSPDYHRDFVRSEFYDAALSEKLSFATMYRTQTYKLVMYHGHEKGELFDMVHDPKEFRNLWDHPDYQQIKLELMKASFDQTVLSMDTGPVRLGRY